MILRKEELQLVVEYQQDKMYYLLKIQIIDQEGALRRIESCIIIWKFNRYKLQTLIHLSKEKGLENNLLRHLKTHILLNGDKDNKVVHKVREEINLSYHFPQTENSLASLQEDQEVQE